MSNINWKVVFKLVKFLIEQPYGTGVSLGEAVTKVFEKYLIKDLYIIHLRNRKGKDYGKERVF